jgi:hypothetical protein
MNQMRALPLCLLIGFQFLPALLADPAERPGAVPRGTLTASLLQERVDEISATSKKPMRLGITLDSPVKAATVKLTISPQSDPNSAQGTGPSAR